jgi:hypothetical protein
VVCLLVRKSNREVSTRFCSWRLAGGWKREPDAGCWTADGLSVRAKRRIFAIRLRPLLFLQMGGI